MASVTGTLPRATPTHRSRPAGATAVTTTTTTTTAVPLPDPLVAAQQERAALKREQLDSIVRSLARKFASDLHDPATLPHVFEARWPERETDMDLDYVDPVHGRVTAPRIPAIALRSKRPCMQLHSAFAHPVDIGVSHAAFSQMCTWEGELQYGPTAAYDTGLAHARRFVALSLINRALERVEKVVLSQSTSEEVVAEQLRLLNYLAAMHGADCGSADWCTPLCGLMSCEAFTNCARQELDQALLMRTYLEPLDLGYMRGSYETPRPEHLQPDLWFSRAECREQIRRCLAIAEGVVPMQHVLNSAPSPLSPLLDTSASHGWQWVWVQRADRMEIVHVGEEPRENFATTGVVIADMATGRPTPHPRMRAHLYAARADEPVEHSTERARNALAVQALQLANSRRVLEFAACPHTEQCWERPQQTCKEAVCTLARADSHVHAILATELCYFTDANPVMTAFHPAAASGWCTVAELHVRMHTIAQQQLRAEVARGAPSFTWGAAAVEAPQKSTPSRKKPAPLNLSSPALAPLASPSLPSSRAP